MMVTDHLCCASAEAAGWVGDFDRPEDPRPSWLTVLLMTAVVLCLLAMALVCSQPRQQDSLRLVPNARVSYQIQEF